MILNNEEKAIIASSQKEYLRKERSGKPFDEILGVFFNEVDLNGKDVLDLGPGHYHLGEIARKRGASVAAIEQDSALVELGRHKGFEVIEGDIKEVETLLGHRHFDGIFCKYSFSAFWFPRAEDQMAFARTLRRALKVGGWAWLAPWNGGPLLTSTEASKTLSAQIEAFESYGFSTVDLSLSESKRFGVHGFTGNRILFTLGLDYPKLTNSGARAQVSPSTIVRTLSESSVAAQSMGTPRDQKRRFVNKTRALARRIIRAVAGPSKKA